MTAMDIVIRDIRNNEQGQLQFSMFVRSGARTVIPAGAVENAVEVCLHNMD